MDELQTIREALESQAKVLEAIDGLSTVTENIKCNDLALDPTLGREAAGAEVERMAREVLTNPVIEEFRFTIEE